jgi:hypothetical protein
VKSGGRAENPGSKLPGDTDARFSKFADVWQISRDFAKDWQNVSRARRMDLPVFGKIGPILPDIGKKDAGQK